MYTDDDDTRALARLQCDLDALDPKARFDRIEKALTRIDAPEIDLPAELIAMADSIGELDGEDDSWIYWGEFGLWTAADLIVGAYWALTEWHGGQASDTYRALCVLGDIYSPNRASGPEPDSGEYCAYEDVSRWLESHA